MFTSKTSIIVAAVAFSAALAHATILTIRDDVSLSRRATNVRPNLGPGPLLHTREFDDESNTRSHDDTEDPNASMLPHASGDIAPKEKWRKSKTYKVLKGIKAGALGVVGALKGLNSKKPKEQKYTQLSRRLEQPNGGASILAKAKRAESDNWKRDLAHSLGLDANYFLKRSYQEKDFVY